MKAFLTTSLLLAALTAIFLLCGWMINGAQGMKGALFLAIVMNFGAWWFSDKLVLMQYGAKEVDEASAPNLYRIVRELAQAGKMPMPKVYIAEQAQPNAFATGRSPSNAAVCATRGLLTLLNNDEIKGVMAHELSHVRNHDTLTMTIAATIAGALGFLTHSLIWGAMNQQNNRGQNNHGLGLWGVLLTIVVAPLAAMLVQLAISRTREYEADHDGALLCGNPLSLASALKKLHHSTRQIPMKDAERNPATAHVFIASPLMGKSVLFATHPSMDERIRRLEALASEQKYHPKNNHDVMYTSLTSRQQENSQPSASSGPWSDPVRHDQNKSDHKLGPWG